jgi:1,4-dihydroxy-2-naphthoyl-CoA hydrolase
MTSPAQQSDPTRSTDGAVTATWPDDIEAMFATGLGLVGRAIGLTLDELSDDRLAVSWTVTPDVHQPNGILHGGLHCWIVETVASIGAGLWFGDRGVVVGVSNQTDFFRAVKAGRLTSVGTPVHRGRSQQLWDVETRDDGGRLVARGQVRLQNLAKPAR